MGSDLFALFLTLFLAVSGGSAGGKGRPSDLLDMIPTASYWRVKSVTVSREQLEADIGPAKTSGDIPKLVKDLESLSHRDDAKKQLEAIGSPALDALRVETGSPDPDAAAMAKDLMTAISSRAKGDQVRRLMAIRTLGERKETASLPLLKSLLDSKELFVADYAARAIANIEGTPLKAEDHHADFSADIDLLPATTGMVAQTTGLGMPGFSLETLANYAGRHADKPAATEPNDANVDGLTRRVLEFAEATGNVRVDGATLALSSGIGQEGGGNEWVVIIAHGLYDREALANFLHNQAHGEGAVERTGGLLTFAPENFAEMMFPSNQELVFVTADPEGTPLASISGPLTEALTSNKPGAIANNQDLMAAIKSTDKTGPIWAAAITTKAMKELPAFAAFDTLTLSSKLEDGVVKVTVSGRGTGDAAAAQTQVNAVQAKLIGAATDMVKSNKDFQPLLDALNSVKVTVDDKGATLTAKVSMDISRTLLAAILQELPGGDALMGPQGPGPGPGGP